MWVRELFDTYGDQGAPLRMGFLGEVDADLGSECYQILANAVDEGVYQADPEGRFVAVNDRFLEITGYTRNAILGEPVSTVVDDTDADRIEREIQRYREDADARAPSIEIVIETVTGDRVRRELHIHRLSDDGDRNGALGILRHAARREAPERDLERYKAIVETVNDGIYTVDSDGRFTMVNETYAEMTGYSVEELLGADVSLVVDDEVVETAKARERELIAGERDTVVLEADIETADGDRVPAEATFALLPASDGSEPERVGVVRDISERKRAERQLRESEERFRTMMEHSPFSMQIFDAEGRTIAANPAWEQLWDAPRSELDDYNILEDEQLEAAGLMPHLREAFAGEAVTLPVVHYDPAEIGKPGRARWIEGHAYPLLPGDGETFEVALVHHDITERKERELELERYEMAVETVWDGITILDSDERFVLVNEAFCELTGYDREDVIGEHATLILDESTYEQAGQLHEEVVEGSQDTATLEYDLLTADGGTVPVEARFGPVEYADGSVGGAGVIRDVSDRQERDRELERALDLLAKTERIADVGGWEIDVETMDVFWTEQIFELLGVSADEEPPLDEALDMYHEADQPVVEGAIEDALGTGEPFDIEARIHTDTGEVRWLRIQGVPELDGDEVVSLRGAAQDITDQKAYEQSLKQYETLIQEAADVNVILDADGTLQYVTPSVGHVLGYDPEELLGEDAFEYLHPADREETRSLFTALIGGSEVPPKGEFRFRHADGSWVWLEAHGRNLLDDPDIDGLVVYTRDITDRKRYEAQLNDTVEKLEESNERLEQFAYVASHDLQEPLRMVSSYLQLLEDGYADDLDADGREFIDYAVDGAERMRAMIQDLLAYSRIETQAEPLEPTDCEAVVERARRNLQVQVDESGAEIEVGPLPTVAADENQLEQVFQNLVSNAIKYRGDGPPRIEIGAERRDDDWVFHVADDGIGIDPEHADRIFDVFQRLHTPEEYPGTGIGLALCQRIVERHGGDIWVESEPGDGSTFFFTLPVSERDEAV